MAKEKLLNQKAKALKLKLKEKDDVGTLLQENEGLTEREIKKKKLLLENQKYLD